MTTISSNTSTSAFFDRSIADMTTLRNQAETLQNQLSTGNKLTTSSDDPVAASQLRQLSRADALSQINTANANLATSDLTLADSALSNLSDDITQVKQLATQAANGTLSDQQRASIGAQISQLYDNIVSIANSRDSSGHALFGGQATGDAYTVDASGNATYAGTASSGDLSLGDGQSVTRGVTGPEVFNFTANGQQTNLFAVVKSLGDALQSGSADAQTAANTALSQLDAGLDAVTTSQTVVGSRQNWITMVGTRATNVSTTRANQEQQIGATDITTTVAQLQQTMLVLQASQAGFAKLSTLSLFNVLQ